MIESSPMKYPADDSHMPTADEAVTLTGYLRKAQQLQTELEEAEAEAVRLKKLLAYYCKDLIPTYMRETGQEPGKVDGRPWKIEDRVSVAQPVETREAFHAWLEREGHGKLIKRSLTVDLGKTPPEEVERLRSVVAEAGYTNATQATKVEPGTAASWVRERYRNKESVPEDLIDVRHTYKVKF